MRKKIEETIKYIRVKGANLIEIMLQNYNMIFYGCLFWNLSVICVILYKEMYLISFIFSLSILVVLNLNKLIRVGNLNLYGDAHKKILFINIFLLILNIINIFFNIFRYIFYDILKIIRQFTRTFLLNYFKIEIPSELDFYFDNLVAYISWDVVYTTIVIMWWLYIEYMIYIVFDWSKEDILLKDDELNKKLFWYFRNNFLLNLSRFCSITWRLLFSIPLIDNYFHIISNKNLLMFFLLFFIFCVIVSMVFWFQYNFMWYWYIYRRNEK